MDILRSVENLLVNQLSSATLSANDLTTQVLPLLRGLKDDELLSQASSAVFGDKQQRILKVIIDCLNTAIKVLQLESSSAAIKKDDMFDSFANSRRFAIEDTIINDKSHLPSIDDIIGHTQAKQALTEALVDPVIYPEWFSSSNLVPWKCILLYGPPGTGKTHLSQSIAKEISSRFYQVTSSDLISTWSGQSEKLIRDLFDHAIAYAGSAVIFIDEVDSLCRVRTSMESNNNRRVKTELLIQMQRLHNSINTVLLICATNCPWDLDTAFLRSIHIDAFFIINNFSIFFMFEKKIFIGPPDAPTRTALLKKFLSKTLHSNQIDWLLVEKLTEGFSGDDLKRLARELAFAQFRKFKEGLQKDHLIPSSTFLKSDRKNEFMVMNPLTTNDFAEILQSFSPAIDLKSLSNFELFNCSFHQ